MTKPLTPETLAELRRLLDAYGPTTGYQPVRDRWFALARGAISALPALMDAAERLAAVEAERDALAAKVAAVRALHTPRGVYGTASRGVMWHCPGCGCNHSSNTFSSVPPCPTIRALDAIDYLRSVDQGTPE